MRQRNDCGIHAAGAPGNLANRRVANPAGGNFPMVIMKLNIDLRAAAKIIPLTALMLAACVLGRAVAAQT
jgi:hypothetical protein